MKSVKIISTVALILFYFALSAQTPNLRSTQKGPRPAIAGKTEGNITKDEFLSDSIIHINNGNAPLQSQMKVVAFKISFAGKGVKYTEFTLNSDTIPEHVKTFVKQAPIGTKLFIDMVKTKSTGSVDNSIYASPPATFIIIGK
jgi:hypothetical protein